MQYCNRPIGIFLFVLLSSLFIMGCKKDKSPVTDTTKPFLIISSTKVDATNQKDTLEKYTYEYDNSDRLINIYKWASPGLKNPFYTFTYNSSGNLTGYVFHGQFGDQNYTLTLSNGLPLTESYSPEGVNASFVQSFVYSNNNNMLVISDNIDASIDTLIYQNNNLIYNGYGQSTTYTYGTHKGPYSTINLKYFLHLGLPYVNANEVTVLATKNTTGPTPTTDMLLSTYTFNADGYPETEKDVDGATSQPVWITYFDYKRGN